MNKGEMLKYSILQMAMKGELVPSDDQDDSTDNILKKINIEKEDLIFKKRLKRDKKESIINRKNDQFYEKKDKEKYCINSEIDFSVPKSWKLMRLGSLVKLLNPLIRKGQNFPYLNAKFLRNQVDPMIKDSGRYIPEGTNIILVDGENSGEVFTTFCEGYLGSTFRELFIPKVLNADFVLYFIESYKEYLKNSKKGAAIPHLNKEIFNNLLIGIPPLEEQERIIEKIEEVLPLVEKYGKLVNELEHIYINEFPEKIRKSILQEAIQGKLTEQDPNDEPASILLEKIRKEKEKLIKENKIKRNRNEGMIYKENGHYYEKIGKEINCIDDEIPFDIPENWAWCRLENIGDWKAGSTPFRNNQLYYQNGTIPWLKTGDLNDGIITKIPERITNLALKETSVRLNPIGSVLIAMYGATIGKLGILNIEATTNQACCACILFGNIYNKYLFYYLMSQKEEFIKKGEGGAQPNISRTKIVNYLFPIPPIEEQRRIVKKIEEILH